MSLSMLRFGVMRLKGGKTVIEYSHIRWHMGASALRR